MMHTEIGTSWEQAAEWLGKNEVVAIPTETVYGLAANAFSEEAVLKIFKAKNRPHFNPLIVHTSNWDSLGLFVKAIPKNACKIAEKFCPGPITFLLEKNDQIPDLVTAGYHKVAIRIPAHPLTLKLLEGLGFPLAAPSANRFGYVSPTTAHHVLQGLQGIIPYILDGGPCAVGVESTIVDFEDEQVIIRRSGGISAEEIAGVVNCPVIIRTHAADHPVAPGQLKSHYATQTPLFTGELEDLYPKFKGKKIALIEFGNPLEEMVFFRVNLSPQGSIDEAARNLFSMMREADNSGADVILASLVPSQGIGAAIMDRLKRAEHLNKLEIRN